MKKRILMVFLCIFMVAISAHAESGNDDSVNVTQMTLSPSTPPQAGEPFTVSVNASCPSRKPINYKFYYCGNYGTADYDTSPWMVVQEYSTDNSAQYVFSEAGNYIIVVRAVIDPANEPAALSIVGQAVSVSSNSPVHISSISSSSAAPKVGDNVTFTTTAATVSGEPANYKFFYCGNYGTASYTTTPWTMVQDYSTDNSCSYSFPSAGTYVVVVRAVADRNNEPSALPIIGTTVSVSEDQGGLDMNEGQWEITTSMQTLPGVPPIVTTTTQCLTLSNSIPDTGEGNCTMTGPVINGNTVTWSGLCQTNQCGQTEYSGSITYSGDTFTGSVVMNSSCGNFTVQISGHRVGDCE